MLKNIIWFVVFAFVEGENLERDFCEDIYDEIQSGNVQNDKNSPSPIDINYCLEKLQNTQKGDCLFDTTSCPQECHALGYATDHTGCEISCKCKINGFLEADIKFDHADLPIIEKFYRPSKKSVQEGASIGLKRWNNNRVQGRLKVPYQISSEMSQKARDSIKSAIDGYAQDTCIDFVTRRNEKDFINFVSRGGCWSYVGRRGGRQDISIGRGCEWKGVVQHELMHALGFWHEQSRPDRDEHIIVKLENVLQGKEHNFQKRIAINSLGSPYDIGSVMHYGGYSFTKNRQPTIVDKATGQAVGAQRNGFSSHDKDQIKTLYGCSSTPITTKPSWTAWGSWSQCTATCGGGEQSRSRTCKLNGVQQTGCEGKNTETQSCSTNSCVMTTVTTTTTTKPTPTSWGSWKSWGSCSKSCGTGYRWRYRVCVGGLPGVGGCKSSSAWQGEKCNTQTCQATSPFFTEVQWTSSESICRYGKLISGDFNGDGRQDLLCYQYNHLTITYLATSTGTFNSKSQKYLATCASFNSQYQLLSGDINGDGLDDIMCRNFATGAIRATLSTSRGFETNIAWKGQLSTRCGNYSTLLLIDVNGDSRNDLVCKHYDGKTVVLLNQHSA